MINRFLHQILGLKIGSKSLFYTFLLVNLIPNLFLLYTEPYNFSGKLLLILLPLGVYLSFLSLTKRQGAMQLWLTPLFFFHAFQLVVFSLFKEDVIAVDMFLNLVTTNVSEATELLGSILLPTLLVCVVYILAIVGAARSFKSKTYYSQSFRNKNLMAGLIIILGSLPLFLSAKEVNTQHFTCHENLYPVNVFYNMGFSIDKFHKINNYKTTSKDFSFQAQKDSVSSQREVYVLVIGETSRADNWQLYGYERETNPYLKKDDSVIFFRDALTQSNTTHKSVSILLSGASAENYDCIYSQRSLIEAFKETGFTTVFLSNQAKNSSFIEYFAQEAEYLEYYRSRNIQTNHFDEVLLHRLQHYIESVTGNLLIVVHTYGSHFNYNERYPKEFAQFMPDQFSRIDKKNREMMVNAYDNSILYTDYFLHRIGQILDESGLCAAYLYISDHGEDIMDDDRERFLHASPNPTYYQLRVPLVTWFSENYEITYPEKVQAAHDNSIKPVSSSMVFHTFLDMADIQTDYLHKNNSLVSTHFTPSMRMYLGDHDNPIPYYQTNLKRQDKEMIQIHGLSVE